MVNFTCNHCGESLQKPRVEKHYQSTACSRSGISVSCMDCFKDFKLEEYVAHIKCITEEERYSAKGSVHAVKKGEVKQSTWVATVNSIIEEQVDAKPSVKSLLEMISKHDNIPRKQAKFVNFITSMSGGRVKVNDINEVWALLEAHKNAAKEEAKKLEATKTEEKSKKSDETEVQPDDASPKKEESPENKEAVLNGNSKKKNKKNKRKADTSEENTETTDVPQKKTKLSENDETVANGVKESKKNKKKGKKEENTEVTVPENGVKKSKKNKKGKKGENKDDKKEENGVVNGANGVVKSKKNKKKKGAKVENGEAEISKSVEGKEEFRWKNAIMDVVNTNEKGLTKDKLREEVFKKYVAAKGQINDKPQLYKQYSKKIKKLLNIKFENNIVTTIV